MPPAPAAVPDPLAPLLVLPGVDEAVRAARDAVDRLLRHRVLRRQSAPVSAESALRGARASADLEGVAVDLAELRSGEPTDPVVVGALRVSAAVGELAGTWERAPLQVIARLHVLAATGRAPAEHLGRPAGDPATSARLDALARLVAGGTSVPAIVLASVVQGELLALTPFGVADGLVARAATRLVLVSRGLDPKSIGVPEVGHAERRDDYAAALADYATGTPDGVARWVRHCAWSIGWGAQEGLAICEAVLRG